MVEIKTGWLIAGIIAIVLIVGIIGVSIGNAIEWEGDYVSPQYRFITSAGKCDRDIILSSVFEGRRSTEQLDNCMITKVDGRDLWCACE